MKKSKYKKLIIYILFWVLIYIIGSFIIIDNKIGVEDSGRSNDMFGEHLKYYEKILEVENESIDLNEIFNNFSWDRAYLVNDEALSSEALNPILGITCDIPAYSGTNFKRIIFIDGDKCVFEFLYDYRYLDFSPDTGFVYNDDAVYEIKNNYGNSITLIKK